MLTLCCRKKDAVALVVQSMDVMARAAEANGQAEVEVDQHGKSGISERLCLWTEGRMSQCTSLTKCTFAYNTQRE